MNSTCFICHRPLKDPKSVERGMGDVCASHNAKDLDLELAQRDDFADEVDASVPFAQAFVMRRRGTKTSTDLDRAVVTNVPHLVVHHSPNGYEFGYGGSGPADLQYEVEDKDKKPVIKHAANLKDIAGIFDVKLPKEFDEQAEKYQNDLDVMIKGLTADAKPSKAKK